MSTPVGTANQGFVIIFDLEENDEIQISHSTQKPKNIAAAKKAFDSMAKPEEKANLQLPLAKVKNVQDLNAKLIEVAKK